MSFAIDVFRKYAVVAHGLMNSTEPFCVKVVRDFTQMTDSNNLSSQLILSSAEGDAEGVA